MRAIRWREDTSQCRWTTAPPHWGHSSACISIIWITGHHPPTHPPILFCLPCWGLQGGGAYPSCHRRGRVHLCRAINLTPVTSHHPYLYILRRWTGSQSSPELWDQVTSPGETFGSQSTRPAYFFYWPQDIQPVCSTLWGSLSVQGFFAPTGAQLHLWWHSAQLWMQHKFNRGL